MSKNTSTPAVVDLSVTMRGDVTLSNLADYVAAFRDDVAKGSKVTYGRTVVYMAARDLSDNFVAASFAREVGISESYVSTLSGLSLAVDRGVTPHGTDVMGRRWAALVQNMSKDVRAALRDKKRTWKQIDSILFAAATDKKTERKTRDQRVKAATEPKSGAVESTEKTLTVEDAITALDQAAAFLALSVLTPAQSERVAAILANVAPHVAEVAA